MVEVALVVVEATVTVEPVVQVRIFLFLHPILDQISSETEFEDTQVDQPTQRSVGIVIYRPYGKPHFHLPRVEGKGPRIINPPRSNQFVVAELPSYSQRLVDWFIHTSSSLLNPIILVEIRIQFKIPNDYELRIAVESDRAINN